VLIAYDRDKAGEKAAQALAEKLLAEGIDAYRIHFPKGMDANEYALQVTPANKSLGVVIRSAQWLGKGKAKPVTTEAVTAESIPLPVAEPESALPESEVEPESEPALESITPLAADAQGSTNTAGAGSAGAVKEKTIEPLPAAAVPPAPAPAVDAEVKDNEVIITLGDRRYRIRGLEKNLAFDVMKINLLVSAPAFDGAGESIHVDTFDLYQQRPRGAFIKQAAVELGVKEEVIKGNRSRVWNR